MLNVISAENFSNTCICTVDFGCVNVISASVENFSKSNISRKNI